jgi:hypothetical protein
MNAASQSAHLSRSSELPYPFDQLLGSISPHTVDNKVLFLMLYEDQQLSALTHHQHSGSSTNVLRLTDQQELVPTSLSDAR